MEMWWDSSLKKLQLFFVLGTLERHETGDTARAILAAIEDSDYLVAGALLPVSQESKQSKNSGYKHSSSYKHGMGPYPAHTEKSSDKVRVKSQAFFRAVSGDSNSLPCHPLMNKWDGGLVLSL